ncbi:MAG: monoamine oxidase [Candidatus Azotimanducaceae bacterium]|jgi:monoamine oxidase
MNTTLKNDVPIKEQLKHLHRLGGEDIGEIGIIGGGISGLVAAYELASLGYRCTIFEASKRIGGRIMTTRYGDQTGELGAMRIPHSHDYVLYYAALLDLALGKFVDQNGNAYYDIRDTVVHVSQGKLMANLFDLSAYERALVEKEGLSGILNDVGRALIQSLTPDDVEHLYTGDFSEASPYVAEIDGTSFLDFIHQRVQSREALELVSAVNAMRDLWHSSCTGVIREVVSHRHQGLKEIVNGMGALPHGIHEKLVGEYSSLVTIHMGAEVKAISTGPLGVTMQVDEGNGLEEHDFEFALCTLPFSVLRRIDLVGASSNKHMAIANYTYADSTKVTLNFKERFWESQKDPIFGGSSITDRIIVQSYYPSNHANDYATPSDHVKNKVHIPLQVPHNLNVADPVQPPLKDPGPGVMLASYTWGKDARRLSVLKPDDRIELVKETIKSYHDGAEVDKYFDGGATMAWHDYRWSAGAFSRLAPRDLQLYYLDAIKPEHNLYFSGEHLSHEPGWIQGSLTSTLGALEELLTRAVTNRRVSLTSAPKKPTAEKPKPT